MSKNPLDLISLRNPIHFLALGFGSGLMKKAPGTWGSLAGLILGSFLLYCFGIIFFAFLTALCFVAGIYICQKTADEMGVHDHGAIVWDEIVGIFIVLLTLPDLSLLWLSLAFISFRFFDILKPYPIRYFDHQLENGFGIMFDDVLAAIYAILTLLIAQKLLPI